MWINPIQNALFWKKETKIFALWKCVGFLHINEKNLSKYANQGPGFHGEKIFIQVLQ